MAPHLVLNLITGGVGDSLRRGRQGQGQGGEGQGEGEEGEQEQGGEGQDAPTLPQPTNRTSSPSPLLDVTFHMNSHQPALTLTKKRKRGELIKFIPGQPRRKKNTESVRLPSLPHLSLSLFPFPFPFPLPYSFSLRSSLIVISGRLQPPHKSCSEERNFVLTQYQWPKA